MARGIIEGLDGVGNERPVRVNRRGRLATTDALLPELLAALLLETKAVRLGLELLNDLQPGNLIDLATEEKL